MTSRAAGAAPCFLRLTGDCARRRPPPPPPVDTQTFSESVKSNRVWWTPEDDQLPDADETPLDVDVSDNPIAKKYSIGETTRR